MSETNINPETVDAKIIINMFVDQGGTVDLVYTEREATDAMVAMARQIIASQEQVKVLRDAGGVAKQALECGAFNANGKAQRMYASALSVMDKALSTTPEAGKDE